MPNSDQNFDDTELWENGTYGTSAEHAVRAPKEHVEQMREAMGIVTIEFSIRQTLLDEIKAKAEKDGVAYQTIMTMYLNRGLKADKEKIS